MPQEKIPQEEMQQDGMTLEEMSRIADRKRARLAKLGKIRNWSQEVTSAMEILESQDAQRRAGLSTRS